MAKPKPQMELTAEQKKEAVAAIRDYFISERDEELGNLAAEMILDFITEKLGKHYYNRGVADSQAFMAERAEDLYSLLIC